MKPDNANSAVSSAATSPSRPAPPGTEPTPGSTSRTNGVRSPGGVSSTRAADRPNQKLSEAEFLKKQADDAKAALTQTLAEMKEKLGQGANPIEWAREYPWISLGVAAAAGFIGTTLVVPSREQQALAKLAAIEKALSPHKPPAANHEAPEKPPGHSLVMMIVRELLAIARPLLLSLLSAGIAGRQARPSEAEMETAAADEQAKEQASP